jgi:hypothetical protein
VNGYPGPDKTCPPNSQFPIPDPKLSAANLSTYEQCPPNSQFQIPNSFSPGAGFISGLAFNIKTGKHWAIQPGINYVQKGGKEQDSTSPTKYSTTLNYLELPINIRYSQRERCFFGFGLLASYGLSGNIKARKGDAAGEVKVKFGNAENELKPVEAGINIFMGYRLPSNIFFAFNINGSFNNISNVPGGYFSNSYMGIRVGYVF